MIKRRGMILVLLLILPVDVSGGAAMEISSSAFRDGEKIPIQYVMPGAGGKNISHVSAGSFHQINSMTVVQGLPVFMSTRMVIYSLAS